MPANRKLMPRHRTCNGFSLIELSIVLFILAILGAGALSTLRLQNERSRMIEARNQLGEARDALLSVAMVNGNLPCPDLDGDGDPEPCAGERTLAGTLPWRYLALPATDPWGQPLAYAVHANVASGRTISLGTGGGIELQALAADGSQESLANETSVVMALWSHGPNGSTETGNSRFPDRIVAQAPGSDDIVVWLSRFVLIGRMLEAGRPL